MYNLYQTRKSNLGIKRIQRYKQVSTSKKRQITKIKKNWEEDITRETGFNLC